MSGPPGLQVQLITCTWGLTSVWAFQLTRGWSRQPPRPPPTLAETNHGSLSGPPSGPGQQVQLKNSPAGHLAGECASPGPCGEAWLKIWGGKVRGGPHAWCTVGGGPPCTPPPGVACSQAPHSMHWGMPHECRACLWAQLGDTRHLACTVYKGMVVWGGGASPDGAQQLHHAGPFNRSWATRIWH